MLIYAAVCRPPKTQAANDAALYEEISSKIQYKQAIVGDFNCPNVDWGLMIWDREGSRRIEMVEDSFFTQVVNQPTRKNKILD